LVKIIPSETDVEIPFSVVDAATAALPTPMTAPAHPDKAKLASNNRTGKRGTAFRLGLSMGDS
jgi:hypothetical protein